MNADFPVACIGLFFLASEAHACEGLEISDAWVRAAPPGATMAAAYFQGTNGSEQRVRLTSIDTAQFRSAMLHESRLVGGQAQMRHLPYLDVGPGATLSAAPGGIHVMLTGPRTVLTVGSTFNLTLLCEQGEPLTVTFTVKQTSE